MIPLAILLAYLGLLLYVGRMGHVGHSQHTAADYFVASRTLGPFLLVMSIFGTTMTAFALVGSTGEAWREGIGVYGLMASWSGIVHSACFFLIGVKLWHFGKLYGYNTQIEFFRDRFQSPALGYLLFPILVTLVVPYIVINIAGAGATIEKISTGAGGTLAGWIGRPVPLLFNQDGGLVRGFGSGLVVFTVFVYVFGGGMRSTAFANVVQTLILLVLSAFALVLVVGQLGGPLEATRQVVEHRPDLLMRGSGGDHDGNMTHLVFLTYFFVPLSVAMFPHLFQHWMTARSAKAFRATVMLHPVFIAVVWTPCIFLGIWASSAVLNGQPVVPPGAEQNQILAIMMRKLTNPVMAGLVGVGVVSATMALDSQFLCLSTMFTRDVVVRLFGEKRFTDQQQLKMARLFVVLVVVAAYLLSLGAPRSVFALGVWCFSGFSALFPLVFAAIYWKRTTAAGAFACILTAAGVWLAMFYNADWGANEEYTFLGMLPAAVNTVASAVALVVVSLLTKAPPQATLDKFFGLRERLKNGPAFQAIRSAPIPAASAAE